jgi:hypothetical protein
MMGKSKRTFEELLQNNYPNDEIYYATLCDTRPYIEE